MKISCLILNFIWIFLVILSKSNTISTTNGTNGWITYVTGDSPIIIVSSHDGVVIPSTMALRESGCWNSATSTCTWQHTCPSGTSHSSSKCPITTSRDTNTKAIGSCIQINGIFQANGHTFNPHYIYNNVKREYLDTNREIGEGCLGDTNCEIAWTQFHNYITSAKADAVSACLFGLVIDIHGHNKTNFTEIGYDISETAQSLGDSEIDDETHSTIESLKVNFEHVALSDVVNGPYSLGQLLLAKRSDWRVTPSQTFDNPLSSVGNTYFQGEYVVDVHGSANGGYVDAIQVEIPSWIRFSTTERTIFCQHLSQAIVEWVQHWHASRYRLCSF